MKHNGALAIILPAFLINVCTYFALLYVALRIFVELTFLAYRVSDDPAGRELVSLGSAGSLIIGIGIVFLVVTVIFIRFCTNYASPGQLIMKICRPKVD